MKFTHLLKILSLALCVQCERGENEPAETCLADGSQGGGHRAPQRFLQGHSSFQALETYGGARIFKHLRSPRIDSKETIPLGYVAYGPVRQPYSYSVASPHRLFKNSSTEVSSWNHNPLTTA